jgi:fluoride ion exporter CrcB/FEX
MFYKSNVMANSNFSINFNTLWYLIIGNLLFIITGGYAKIQHWEHAYLLLAVGLIFSFTTMIIIVIDLIKNKNDNKMLWIIGMFIVPSFTSIFYMLKRDQMLRLSKHKNH